MTEYRRILLGGAIVETERQGEELVARDGRRVAIKDAIHLPPVQPGKIIAVHLNHVSRVHEFAARRAITPDVDRLGASLPGCMQLQQGSGHQV